MSTTSTLIPICVSDFLPTKHFQTYHGGLTTIPKIDGLHNVGDGESICLAIANTVANLYKVQSREDYARYAKDIAPIMLSKVHGHVAENEPILLVVLASQLSQYEGAPRGRKFKPEDDLFRLDELCKQISTIYSPGARVDVVMDGLIYNNLFGIGDIEEWESINAMQEVAAKRYPGTLNVLPIWNLLQDEHDDIPLPLEEARCYFLHHAQLLKDHLISRFGNPDNNSITIPPIFNAKYVNEHYFRLRGGENKSTAAKVALQALANVLDSAFDNRVHIPL